MKGRKIGICKLLCTVAFSVFTILTVHKPLEVYAAELVVGESIPAGTDCTAVLDAEGTLTISGTGEITTQFTTYSAQIKKVVIEEGITNTKDAASYTAGVFYNCKSITSVTLPSTLENIGNYSFYSVTGLVSIDFPSAIVDIGKSAFDGCTGLTTITLPESLKTIGYYAFYGCTSVTDITINSQDLVYENYYFSNWQRTDIYSRAFYGCTSLERVFINGKQATTNKSSEIFSNSGIAEGITFTFGEGITSIPTYLFYKNTCKIKELQFPSTLTTIETYAFSGCTGLKSIVIPNTVSFIGQYAFSNCTGATSLYIPNTVSFIGQYAFSNCTSLKEITIPESVTEVNGGIFSNCTNVETINYNANLNTVGSIFSSVGSTTEKGVSITIGDNVTLLPKNLFNYVKNLKKITIPDSITTMGTKVFTGATSLSDEVTVRTKNEVAMNYNWLGDGLKVVFRMGSDKSLGEDGLTLSGSVASIQTLDINIPLSSLSFSIDGNRDFHAETTYIGNNCNCPIEVYMVSISGKNGTEPAIVATNTYTEKEWNNLRKEETLSELALKVNNLELYTIYNNTELDRTKAIKIGDIDSGYRELHQIGLTPSAQYGKNFGNTETLTLEYDVVFEFRIP